MMTAVSEDAAGELAVWLGQIFTHLNDEQVREFKRVFFATGCDRATIEGGVRRYMRAYQYATVPGICDAIAAQRRADVAKADAQAKAIERQADVEQLVEQRIDSMSDIELGELHNALIVTTLAEVEKVNPQFAARHREQCARANPRYSARIRAHFRDIIVAEVKAHERANNGDGGALQSQSGPSSGDAPAQSD